MSCLMPGMRKPGYRLHMNAPRGRAGRLRGFGRPRTVYESEMTEVLPSDQLLIKCFHPGFISRDFGRVFNSDSDS